MVGEKAVTQEELPPPSHAAPQPRKRRGRRIGLGILACLVLGIGTAPQWGAPWLRGQVAKTLGSTFEGRAEVETLGLTWGGRFRLSGLQLEDDRGQPMLEVDSLDATIAPWAAVRGRYQARAELQGFAIHLRQNEDGHWNWAPAKSSEPEGQAPSSPSEPLDPSESLQVELIWNDGTLVIEGPGGQDRFVRLEGRAHWPGGAQPGTLQARIHLPNQADPVLELEANLQPTDRLDLDRLVGEWVATVRDLSTDSLSAWQHPAEGPAPEGTVRGSLRGTALGFASAANPDSAHSNSANSNKAKSDRPAPSSSAPPQQGAEEEAQEAPWPWTLQGSLEFEGRWPLVMAPEGPPSSQSTAEASGATAGEPTVEWIEQSARLEIDSRAKPLESTAGEAGVHVHLHRFAYLSPTAEWTVQGHTQLGADPQDLSADLQGTLRTPLGKLVRDLEPWLGWETIDLAGDLEASFQVVGRGGQLRTEGSLDARQLRVAGQVDAERDVRFEDPHLQMSWKGSLDATARAASIERFAVQSETLSGSLAGRVLAPHPEDSSHQSAIPSDSATTQAVADNNPPSVTDPATAFDQLVLSGVRIDGTYHPSRLGALLGPWLPGTLEGETQRPLSLELEGRLGDLDPMQVLQGLQGKATIDLGQYSHFGLATSGQVTLESAPGAWSIDGALEANGGRATLQTRLPRQAAEDVASTFRFTLDGTRTNPELGSLLAWVHPAFQALDAQRAGDLTGLLSASLELRYDGALQPELLENFGERWDWSLLSGSGRIQIDEASFAGSPLMREILGWMGRSADTPVRLRPLSFQFQGGRIHYEHPWEWTVEGAPTSFAGSIGLDRSLQLDWSVPISSDLARKHKVLRPLVGQSIQIPIRGTIESPTIDLQGVLRDLAGRALEESVEDAIEERLQKEVDKLLGGSKDPKNGPEALLSEADRLYAAGQKAEAKALYQQLREKHRESLTYLLNRSRIKRRARE